MLVLMESEISCRLVKQVGSREGVEYQRMHCTMRLLVEFLKDEFWE